MTDLRDKVVWVGTAPDEVRDELAARGLTAIDELDLARVVHLAQRAARAVVVHVDRVADLAGMLHALVAPCHDAGATVFLAADRRDPTQLLDINHAQATIGEELPSCMPRLFVLAEVDAARRLAEECRIHDPGPSLESAPALGPADVIDTLESSVRCLLERAFHRIARVELTEFKQGRSSARVFRADGIDDQGRKYVSMIAKVDTAARIEQEILNTKAFVTPYVESWWYATLVGDRCMYGARHGVLVGTFLAGARSLDDVIPTAASVPMLITSLFDGPLKSWRANARLDVPIKLSDAYRGWGVLEPDTGPLEEAYRLACEAGNTVLTPHEILGILDGLPPVLVRIRMTHGDLQPRNIFVRDNGHLFLIDFYGSRHEAAVSRDPATLDVTLAFEPKANLDDAALTALYRAPVLRAATGVFADPWRAAIGQVRAQAAVDDVTEREYDISITCYLLRMARLGVQFGELSEARIALAYSLASRLAESLR